MPAVNEVKTELTLSELSFLSKTFVRSGTMSNQKDHPHPSAKSAMNDVVQEATEIKRCNTDSFSNWDL